MEVDPLAILFTLIRISAVILLIIFFMGLWGVFGTQAKENDLERFNAELFENIATSEITYGKYVFDPDKMNDASFKNENFVNVIRDCKYKYSFEVENLETGDEWSFGEETNSAMSKLSQYDYRSVKEYYAGVVVKNPDKNAPFYEDVDVAKVTLTVTDTLTGRLSCAVEKAYKSKKAEKLQLKGCLETPACITFRRNGGKACFYRDPSKPLDSYMDCKILPTGAEGGADFAELAQMIAELKGQDTETKPITLTAYPLKNGGVGCESIESNPGLHVAGPEDAVNAVKICVTNQANK